MTPDDVLERLPRTERKCPRHRWVRVRDRDLRYDECDHCGKVKDQVTSKRNRRNKHRGLDIQRQILAEMGIEHIPGNKPNHDGRAPTHVAEVKSGGRFSETRYRNIVDIPRDAEQTRWLIECETPGAGHKRRVIVSTVLEDWLDRFGGE